MKKIIFIFIFTFLCCPFLAHGAGTIEINTASLQQLETLSGIGPVKAQAIINARPFSSVGDLLRVSGIGQKTLQKIENQGFAYVSGQLEELATTTKTSDAQNVPAVLTSSPTDTQLTTTPAYPGGVFINEILPNPQGPDGEDEWIELHNSNNYDVDLSGWQLQDKQGTITTFTVAAGTKILSDGFLIFKRPDTNIMLNNDTDGLNLITPDGKVADSMDFTAAPLEESYNKTSAGWRWSTTPTPGAANIITVLAAPSQAKALSNNKNSVKNNLVTAGLADVSQNIGANQADDQATNPWFLFFIVLAATIILATAVLLIKLKVLKNHVRT